MKEQIQRPLPSHQDFHIFTTFRLDNTLLQSSTHAAVCGGHQTNVYLLEYHYDRIRGAAASMTGFRLADCVSNLYTFEQRIQDELRASSDTALQASPVPTASTEQSIVRRGKISAWPDGRLEVSLVPVAPANPILFPKSFNEYTNPSWTVILDSQPTEASLYTEIKTSHRTDYDRARQDAGLTPASNTEVLLYNSKGEVMDGSITTAYFFRDGKWVTTQAGGLEGTTRRFALDHELCSIAQPAVRIDTLKDGEVIWLSNAFRGFFPAVFRSP